MYANTFGEKKTASLSGQLIDSLNVAIDLKWYYDENPIFPI